MYISLWDVAALVLFAVGIAAAVYLILVLRQVLGLLILIRSMLTEYNPSLAKTLAVLPQTLNNVSGLAAGLQVLVEQTSATLDNWQTDVTDTVDDLKSQLEALAGYGQLISEFVQVVFRRFR